MTGPTRGPSHAAGIGAGAPVSRRAILRRGARAVLSGGIGLSLPAVLSGCGEYYTYAPRPLLYAVELLADEFPGFPALLSARARTLDVEIHFNQTGLPSDQATAFARDIDSTGFINPVTDRYPLTYDVVVLQPAGGSTLDATANAYLKQGGKLVTYLAPLAEQTAQISVDTGQCGSMLATHAVGWAHDRGGAHWSAVVVAPKLSSGQGNRFLAGLPAAEQTIRETFARHAPTLGARTVTDAAAAARAIRTDPRVRVVLCTQDSDAVSLAEILRRDQPATRRAQLYVGGIGSPTPSTAALGELRRDDLLRAIVAVRPGDLADALVALPVALLRNRSPYNLVVAPQVVTPGSAALRAFASDYATPAGDQTSPFLNPIINGNSVDRVIRVTH